MWDTAQHGHAEEIPQKYITESTAWFYKTDSQEPKEKSYRHSHLKALTML